jgi:hypothetical protein
MRDFPRAVAYKILPMISVLPMAEEKRMQNRPAARINVVCP